MDNFIFFFSNVQFICSKVLSDLTSDLILQVFSPHPPQILPGDPILSIYNGLVTI